MDRRRQPFDALLSDQMYEFITLYHSGSKASFAAYCGVSLRTVYRWLSGETPVPASVARSIELERLATSSRGFVTIRWEYRPDGLVWTPYGGFFPHELEEIPLMRRYTLSLEAENKTLRETNKHLKSIAVGGSYVWSCTLPVSP